MARYWIGGTGSWSQTSHWSSSSGGLGGETAPTSADNVFIDANSGFGAGGTITLDGNKEMNDFSATSGHTFSIDTASGTPTFYGSVLFEAGMTLANQASGVTFSPTGSETLTTAGVEILFPYFGTSGTITLQDDLVHSDTGSEFYVGSGTFDANGHNVTYGDIILSDDDGASVVNMGSGTWTAIGNDVTSPSYVTFSIVQAGLGVTINAESSTIKLTDSTTEDKTFSGGGKTYNNIWFDSSGDGALQIQGSNTFNDFKVTQNPDAIIFQVGTTTKFSTWNVSGASGIGNLVTLTSSNGIDQFTLTKTSGIVSSNYLDISNSNATGGATWYAGSNSLNNGNNTGWLFQDIAEDISKITGSIKKEKMSGEIYLE